MGTVEAEEVITRDVSSGVVHKRYRIPGRTELVVAESDNLDAAGAYDVVPRLADLPAYSHLCHRCFPRGETTVETDFEPVPIDDAPPGEENAVDVPDDAAAPEPTEEAPVEEDENPDGDPEPATTLTPEPTPF